MPYRQTFQQLNSQIQQFQQSLSQFSQICSQLAQSERSNVSQLQQMQQAEQNASQQLQQMQQLASQLSQQMSQLSSMMSQIANQVSQPGFISSAQPGNYQTSSWAQRHIPTQYYGPTGQYYTGQQYGVSGQQQYGIAGQYTNPGEIPTGRSAFNTNKDLQQ